MADFNIATFERAATILADTVDDCLHNVAHLKTDWPDMTQLRVIDTASLHNLLRTEEEGGKIYCVLGEAVPPAEATGGDSQRCALIRTGEEQRYRLNTAISNANVIVATKRSGKDEGAEVLSFLGKSYDEIALRATALEEAFIHLSKVLVGDDLQRLKLGLLQLQIASDTNPLDDARRAAAWAELKRLVKIYHDRLQHAVGALEGRTFDPAFVRNYGPGVYKNSVPIFETERDGPGARIINDVWFPERYATPLLHSLAEQQTQTIAPSRPPPRPRGRLSKLLDLFRR
ncbi:MAG: hypothetical protein JSR47_17565 [Proteobacteria bacterium]|nr:hypothetical protein [Pseudomonadota bacterium]